MWVLLGLTGLLVVVTGALPADQAREVAWDRGAPVLGFLIAVTVLAETAQRTGVFDVAAACCARAGRGRTAGLYALVAVLGTVVTIVLSLDTTAVLLTPVVLALTARLQLRPLPFALLVVWLANTASLLLPVSNLTNLLARQRGSLSTVSFAARMGLPELAAVIITTGYLALVFRRDLRGRYTPPTVTLPTDRVSFWVCTAGCAAVVPAVLGGVTPWLVAAPAAAVTLLTVAMRQPGWWRGLTVPWRLVISAEGLFLAIAALSRHGLTQVLTDLAGTAPLRIAAVAGATSNVVNNLPAYLALEGAVPGHTTDLLAVLIGTNAGPLVLLWGSLATLLWRERCRAAGVHISAARFAAIGLPAAVAIVAAGAALLAV